MLAYNTWSARQVIDALLLQYKRFTDDGLTDTHHQHAGSGATNQNTNEHVSSYT